MQELMMRIVDKIEQISKFFSVWARFHRRLRNRTFRKAVKKIWWRTLSQERATIAFFESLLFFALTVVFLYNWIKMSLGGESFAIAGLILAIFAAALWLNCLTRLTQTLTKADTAAARIVANRHRAEQEAAEEAAETYERREPTIVRRRFH